MMTVDPEALLSASDRPVRVARWAWAGVCVVLWLGSVALLAGTPPRLLPGWLLRVMVIAGVWGQLRWRRRGLEHALSGEGPTRILRKDWLLPGFAGDFTRLRGISPRTVSAHVWGWPVPLFVTCRFKRGHKVWRQVRQEEIVEAVCGCLGGLWRVRMVPGFRWFTASPARGGGR